MRLIPIVFLMLIVSLPAFAREKQSPFTGADLLKMCASTSDIDYGFCAGYVTAIANALLKGPIGTHMACNHAPVRSQQAIDIYRSYAEIFPEAMQDDAAIAVASAFSRSFPCR